MLNIFLKASKAWILYALIINTLYDLLHENQNLYKTLLFNVLLYFLNILFLESFIVQIKH